MRGIGTEYFVTGVNPRLSPARFYEAHDLILQAWTKPGPFRYTGRHYEFEYVNLWPRPVQQPHPPVWIPSQGSVETIEWCAHPDPKYTYLQTFSPISLAKKCFAKYREVAVRHGYASTPMQLGWAVPIYVAETDAKARSDFKLHVENFFNRFLRYSFETRLPPGYSSIDSTKTLIEQKFKVRAAIARSRTSSISA